jgi:coiled-coil domain-containing protein 55
MKAAARRQIEFEKMQDRKYSKEREGEGDLWSDKEVFVTTAYRKRMEERLKIEEEEKNQDMIDNLLDVKKQKDLSGFYTSMLKIRTGEMVLEEESQKEKRLKEETKFKETQQKHNQKSFRTKNRDESSSEEDEIEKESIDEEKQVEQNDTQNIQTNDQVDIKTESNKGDEMSEPLFKKPKSEVSTTDSEKKDDDIETKLIEDKKPILSKEEEKQIRREKIFTKRTVGDRFDAELAEFFKRKSQHLSLKSYIERE